MEGVDIDTSKKRQVECQTSFYDADIGVDAILSYGWLVSNHIDVRCKNHGLEVRKPEGPVFISGLTEKTFQRSEKGVFKVTYKKEPHEAKEVKD